MDCIVYTIIVIFELYFDLFKGTTNSFVNCVVLYGFIVENFDPVTVWILDESKSFHASIVWTLNELDSVLFEAFTSGIDIRDKYSNVSKTTGLGISIVIALCGITFSSPIAGINLLIYLSIFKWI